MFILGDIVSLAYVMIDTVPDKIEVVLEDVKGIKGVEETYMLYGINDIIAKVKAGNFEELWTIIIKIRKLQHILSTLTLQVVS